MAEVAGHGAALGGDIPERVILVTGGEGGLRAHVFRDVAVRVVAGVERADLALQFAVEGAAEEGEEGVAGGGGAAGGGQQAADTARALRRAGQVIAPDVEGGGVRDNRGDGRIRGIGIDWENKTGQGCLVFIHNLRVYNLIANATRFEIGVKLNKTYTKWQLLYP